MFQLFYLYIFCCNAEMLANLYQIFWMLQLAIWTANGKCHQIQTLSSSTHEELEKFCHCADDFVSANITSDRALFEFKTKCPFVHCPGALSPGEEKKFVHGVLKKATFIGDPIDNYQSNSCFLFNLKF